MLTGATKIHTPRPFNQPLVAAALDIDEKQRANRFAWRGQFSPQFVQAILESYSHKNDVVLDPFVGSGTVLVEAASLGHEAYGVEVNASAERLASIYTLVKHNPDERKSLLSHTDEILSRYVPIGLPIFQTDKARGYDGISIKPLIDHLSSIPSPDIRLLIEALIVKLDLADENTSTDILWLRWNELRSLVNSLPHSTKKVSVLLGDARYLPLENGSIDFVFTSPPYINVFNYHHNYRKSIELLGWQPLISAKSEIGANRKFRQNRFLTVVQYCIDMSLSLVELARVCRSSARIVFVVGRESNVHKTAFYNGAILRRIAENIVGIRTTLQQERKFQNKFGKLIKEDILHFLPDRERKHDRSRIIEQARQIGQDVLLRSWNAVPKDRRVFLDDAITRANEVKPSEEFIESQAKAQ